MACAPPGQLERPSPREPASRGYVAPSFRYIHTLHTGTSERRILQPNFYCVFRLFRCLFWLSRSVLSDLLLPLQATSYYYRPEPYEAFVLFLDRCNPHWCGEPEIRIFLNSSQTVNPTRNVALSGSEYGIPRPWAQPNIDEFLVFSLLSKTTPGTRWLFSLYRPQFFNMKQGDEMLCNTCQKVVSHVRALPYRINRNQTPPSSSSIRTSRHPGDREDTIMKCPHTVGLLGVIEQCCELSIHDFVPWHHTIVRFPSPGNLVFLFPLFFAFFVFASFSPFFHPFMFLMS